MKAKNNKLAAYLSIIAVIAIIFAISVAAQNIAPRTSDTDLLFYNEQNTLTASIDSSTGLIESGTPMFIVSREPVIYDTVNNTKYEITVNGVSPSGISCNAELPANLNLEQAEITTPVVYIEQSDVVEKISAFASSDNMGSVEFTISDSSEKFPDAEASTMIEFTSINPVSFPYKVLLISNGKTYDGSSYFYFDNESGEFLNGYIVFVGVDYNTLSQDAELQISSTFNLYKGEQISISK